MPPFQQVSREMYGLLKLHRATISAVIVKWKRQGATMAQPQIGRSHKLTERDRVARKNNLFSVANYTLEAMSAQ